MSIFVGTSEFSKIAIWVAMETIQFHTNQMGLFLRKNIFWLLSGLIEEFGIHEKLAQEFNVCLIIPRIASLSNGFTLILKLSLIFMNMQM